MTAPKVLIPATLIGTTAVTYTSPAGGGGSYLDYLVSTNYSAAAEAVSVNVITAGDAVGSNNASVIAVSIAPNATYRFPELTGRYIGKGDVVSVVAGSNAHLNFAMTGREVS